MRFDERAQSIQIGAVLLFAALILALAGYQAFVVPQQNEQVEFSHSQTVQNQLTDLRNALVSVPGDSSARSVGIQLGTRYPGRVLTVNPGPPTGALRTSATNDDSVVISVEHAVATGEAGDFWDGGEWRNSTGWVTYRPNYNVYGGAPTTIYGSSVLHNDFTTGSNPLTGQTLVDGDRISLVAVDGSLDVTRTGSATVDVRPVSASTTTVTVSNETATEPVTIRVPTYLSESAWSELLAGEFVDDGGHVVESSLRTVPLPDVAGAQMLEFELQTGETYDLQLSKAGVGRGAADTDEAYMTDVTGDGLSISEGGSRQLVVEVRDAFDNPVSGVRVEADAAGGTLDDSTVRTGPDGRAAFRYTANPNAGGSTYAVQFSYVDATTGFDGDDPEDVSMAVTVAEGASDGVTDDSQYSLVWQSPPGPNAELDVGSQGDTLELTAALSDVDGALESPSIEGATVDFALNNSTVGTVSPSDAATNADGEAETTFTAESNGTVRLYATSDAATAVLNLSVVNVTSDPGPPGPLAYDDADRDGEYDDGETTYQKSTLENGFDNDGVDLVIPADVGTLSRSRLDLSANSIRSDVGFEATNGDLSLDASGGDLHVVGQSLSAQNGEVSLTSGGETRLDGSTVESTTSSVTIEGDTVSLRNGDVTATNDDLEITAGSGPLDAFGASLTTNTGDLTLESRGGLTLESATVSASNGAATADLGQGSNTLYVDGAAIDDSDDTLEYEPGGITVDGSPDSGSVSS